MKTELRNNSDLEFSDISSEKWRQYDWGHTTILIESPLSLNVSESGGHRVLAADGVSHYIPSGWIHLSWEAKDGAPHFVK